jgi:hypothetical protein
MPFNEFDNGINLPVDFLITYVKHTNECHIGVSIWQDGTCHHVRVGLENLCWLFISPAKSNKLVKNVIPLVGGGLVIRFPYYQKLCTHFKGI